MKLNYDRLPANFWAKVRVSDSGCWEWAASTRKGGYGRFRSGSAQRPAHRVAYEALVGPITDGLELDHLCRVKGCVNPSHLEPVTRTENIRRGVTARAAAGIKVRSPKARSRDTHCKNGHLFTPETTYMRANNEGRACLLCRREENKRYRRRLKANGSPDSLPSNME